MHFILHAGEVTGRAVGIELIVQLEYHAQRILRVGKGLQVPGLLARNLLLAVDHQAQAGDVVHFGHAAGKLQYFAGDRSEPWLRRSNR